MLYPFQELHRDSQDLSDQSSPEVFGESVLRQENPFQQQAKEEFLWEMPAIFRFDAHQN